MATMRTVFHNTEAKQINYLDNRYYTLDEKTYYPSVTTILEVFPKGFGFEQWLKDVGSNASEIANRAAESGSKVHSATEFFHEGVEILWANEHGLPNYTFQEWEMILRYKEFWTKCQPELIANETMFCSDELRFGGTLDRVVMIAGKRWLIDVKTSNYLHKSYELQLSAYAEMWNLFNPSIPIEETGILWLKANTRTDKIDVEKNIFQGIGWQVKTFERHYSDAFKIFKHAQAIWEEENPTYKPLNKIYPDRIKL